MCFFLGTQAHVKQGGVAARLRSGWVGDVRANEFPEKPSRLSAYFPKAMIVLAELYGR